MLLDNNDSSEEVLRRTSYTVMSDIVSQVGVVPAYILAILEHHAAADGVQLTHRQLADLAGTTHITARRSVHKLRDADLLKSEEVIEGQWQKANWYQVPTFAKPDHPEHPPAHIEQVLLVDIDTEKKYQIEDQVPIKGIQLDINSRGEAAQAQPTELADSEVVLPVDDLDNPVQGDDPGDQRVERLADHLADHVLNQVVPLGQAMGARCARTRRNIFTRSVEVDQIVTYFKQKIEAVEREVKNDKRLRGWKKSAEILLQDGHDVEDILKVIDYCAQTNRLGLKKITNLKQIRDDFEYLQESAQSGQPNSPRFPEIISPAKLLELRKRLEEHV